MSLLLLFWIFLRSSLFIKFLSSTFKFFYIFFNKKKVNYFITLLDFLNQFVKKIIIKKTRKFALPRPPLFPCFHQNHQEMFLIKFSIHFLILTKHSGTTELKFSNRMPRNCLLTLREVALVPEINVRFYLNVVVSHQLLILVEIRIIICSF